MFRSLPSELMMVLLKLKADDLEIISRGEFFDMKITEQDINEAKIQARAEGAAQGMAKGMARGKAEERTGILRKPVDALFKK